MTSPLPGIINELMPTMRRGDVAGYHRLQQQLFEEAQRRSAAELTEAVELLAPILARKPEGIFAQLALVAGAYVEWGASPMPLAKNAPACAVMSMMLRQAFSNAWPQVGGGRPEPDLEDPPGMTDLTALFQAAASELESTDQVARSVAMSWFDTRHWVNLMITLLGHREFRDAVGLKQRLAEEAERVARVIPRANWLPGLALVLDDEPLVAIDDATGRGYRLTMSGVGDNFQLHTLMADRLIGDPDLGLLPGEPPKPSWIAAATTGPVVPANLIHRRFRLFDGTGAYVSPEGRPADIAVVDGVRLVVLHPAQVDYSWRAGRTYEAMVPTLTLDRILTPDEAKSWHDRAPQADDSNPFHA